MTTGTSPTELSELLNIVTVLAKVAGERILEIYEAEDFGVEKKADESPLTLADTAAHNVILAGLKEATPNWPVLSEESAKTPFAERAQWSRYWLVDPLDGTREFIKRNGEFTVNIALIENQRPVLGVVYVPVSQVCYSASASEGAFKAFPSIPKQAIKVRACLPSQLTVAGSRSHADEHLQKFMEIVDRQIELISIGSALKICLVAEGTVDVYPRFGPTSEWDTAAAQCVVEQAGGFLTDIHLQPLRYNTKESLLNPYFFVYGDVNENWAHYLDRTFAT